ncbi:hypothetical protein Cva_00852 [Caedimonas varicaedens]|uniref:Uncharacterized protein n=1 Tax=Caedimonas varicaedens TaxID=1629334 RepID=A0A0K8MEA6_9PROT|nr:hypothetical protein Cva_00852 [Caedimonas varicaedens]
MVVWELTFSLYLHSSKLSYLYQVPLTLSSAFLRSKELVDMKKKIEEAVKEYIYRRFITLRNGKRLDAHDFGLRAFKFPVKIEQ